MNKFFWLLIILVSSLSIVSAEDQPFSKPSGTYCCDFRDNSTKCLDIVEKCAPGALEVTTSVPAVIRVGYRYIGKAPVYIKMKSDCPKGTVLSIVAQPEGVKKNEPGELKEQVTEYVCGSFEPVKVHFDMESGLKTFSYYDYPKHCSPLEECVDKKGAAL